MPIDRYARQRQFPPIGDAGQAAIQSSHVAILGCGALGSVAAEILARGGVGRLTLIDRDIIEWSNLQRQSLYVEADARQGLAKAAVAAERLSQIDGTLRIEPHVVDVAADNIAPLLAGCDLVIDAADNFTLRLLLNDWSLRTSTPWVHGGCVGATGQVRLFTGTGSPCFRCLVPQVPPPGTVATCDTAGVIAAATHLIASAQAAEAIKWLSGNRHAIRDHVWAIDLWNNRVRDISISPELSATCIACGQGRYEFLDARVGGVSAAVCGRDAVQIAGKTGHSIDFAGLAQRWQSIGIVQRTSFFVRVTLPEDRVITVFRDGRALIGGTTEVARARSLYDQYVGT